MIKNMKIKKSLILGFGVTIVVSLAIIIAAIVLMTIQKNQYMDIIDKYVGANDIVSECRIDYNIAARGLRDAVLGGDLSNLDTATQKVNDLSQRLNDLDAECLCQHGQGLGGGSPEYRQRGPEEYRREPHGGRRDDRRLLFSQTEGSRRGR